MLLWGAGLPWLVNEQPITGGNWDLNQDHRGGDLLTLNLRLSGTIFRTNAKEFQRTALIGQPFR
ncbi:MAG: hypothetical protein H6937_05505 [Burkholderiales bacterium]|nr:hypothetical protein [Burkholderiales bacterium]